jgi:hypothetical protein
MTRLARAMARAEFVIYYFIASHTALAASIVRCDLRRLILDPLETRLGYARAVR